MSRYIDADKLLNPDNIIVMQDETGIDEFPYTYTNAVKVETILNSPTADVVEVRHGHWIEHTEKPDWLEDDVEVFYNCSECGTSHWSISSPYCPNCGAKMDGERSENGT